MHRMSFLREQYMHRCILSPFSEMLHAKAVGTAPSGNATIVCLERESHVFADDNQTILEIARTPQRRETDVIIELRSKDAMLPVTQDHRVPVHKACRGKMEHTEYGQGMQLFRSNWQLIPHPPHPTHLPLTYPSPTGPERSARASDTPQHFGSSYFGTKHSSPRRSRLEHLPPHTRDSHFMDAYIQSKDCREFMDCREKLPRIR